MVRAAAVISSSRAHAGEIRRAELERAERSPDRPTDDRERLDRTTVTIVNTLLHEPTVRVRAEAERGQGICSVRCAQHPFAPQDPAEPRP